ncbi:phosphoenolpyruvate carboxylase [Paenibacillus beijingensis]|uniref:Phosphoenolpyruvate carboxylase n=1 Tax=Paenibacillus beijingensis TaxID=1126833 RepID=A0A0D5NJ67_9BACL|nr:phosphoenolpyruvate carboxylase [Paenibacillus beijingensis]AJY75311.1 phosphoenolpyruvate carboxylase [Paenibacillus beijingensis]
MSEQAVTTQTTNRPHSNNLLRRDVRFLGNILGEVLVHQGGRELLDVVEKIRETSKALRAEFIPELFEEFKSTITSLNPEIRHQVIRAFAIYFQLVNIAEQNHRVRRKRDYERSVGETVQPGSIEDAVQTLKERGIAVGEVNSMLEGISLELVMTAHPTEATRRVVQDIHQRIATNLMELDNPMLSYREREKQREKLLNDVLILWQTDELRNRKPTVIDEVRNGLFYFDETLFETLPNVYEELERCLSKYYPGEQWHVPAYLRFGSWIGGDRDGNPSVTAKVTWETLKLHRQLAIRKYEEILKDWMGLLSFSTNIVSVPDELLESISADQSEVELKGIDIWRNSKEPYKVKLCYMLEKLANTRDGSLKGTRKRYNSPAELKEDLLLIDRSLRAHYADYTADSVVQKLIRQVELFGFHMAALDIRQHSKEHENAMAEVLAKNNIESDFSALSEDEKIALLERLLADPGKLTSDDAEYSESTRECLDVFRTVYEAQQEFGTGCITSYLISMARGASDMLMVMVFAKEFGLFRQEEDGSVICSLQSVPLFETIDDLHAAPGIMKRLFDLPLYRKAVEARGEMHEIMLGYSDSNKDGGVVTANWELKLALNEITAAAAEYGVKLKFFHGRGGALGRGGMPLNRSILAQPPHTIGAGIKITEQGEVLSSRYSMQGIAYRSLEQATWALITAARLVKYPEQETDQESEWNEIARSMSETAQTKYQDLIFRDPDFMTFFKESTPLSEVGELNIGSRPSKRKNSDRFEDLRAIPWVFAWTQSRYLLPAWYAAGTAFEQFVQNDPAKLDKLREMYKGFPFFRQLVDNLQMALAKADLNIAQQYAGMISDAEVRDRIFNQVKEEHALTLKFILDITGQQDILDNVPVIQESIRLRNPYVDPLSYMQVELLTELRKLREQEGDDTELLREVLLTINGIAAGLRNTG